MLIIFGLLGLVVFINLFGMFCLVFVVGGLVLILMILLIIIIFSWVVIKSVLFFIWEVVEGIGVLKM